MEERGRRVEGRRILEGGGWEKGGAVKEGRRRGR